MKQLSLREPDSVMRLDRLGSLHQCRLSFMRQLTRRMACEAWTFERPIFDIDEHGVGTAVYTTNTGKRRYSLVAFAHNLPPEQRSDRVIAQAWDATFALFDGTPTQDDVARLRQNVPYQEAGRVSARELSVSRANRSVRLWDVIIDALAAGEQPSQDVLDDVGYLMRTTAVYGSGKLGAADRAIIADRPECRAPFQIEMLSVYLTRTFVRDLMNHMARVLGGDSAVVLDDTLAMRLGIGNSTGLGMAPFLINHPRLFNNWIAAREIAIARVCAIETAKPQERTQFENLWQASKDLIKHWKSEHPLQIAKLNALQNDADKIDEYLASDALYAFYPWQKLMSWAGQGLSLEGQELLASLILEPYGSLVDSLGDAMADDTPRSLIDGAKTIGDILKLIEDHYDWALAIDWDIPDARARAWYVSEEKLEPRLGERYDEPLDEYEQPLAPAYDVARVYDELLANDPASSIAEFLSDNPQHRHIIRRVFCGRDLPYGEIRDNTIGADMLPIDMLRAKLSFFGATRFDPRSDRWLRIAMYQGAPYPEQLSMENADYWIYDGLSQ